MEMTRRGFLGLILASGVAPAFARASSLDLPARRIIIPSREIIVPKNGGIINPFEYIATYSDGSRYVIIDYENGKWDKFLLGSR